jgi:glycosyltransferase involved in cell wall biosynthesis
MNKPTVTICIPAYNEQHNIDNILKQIFAQKQDNYILNKVIVASDGSTDNTVNIAKKYLSLGVEVINGKANKGQTYRQNEMIAKASSDILVLLNADLLIHGEQVLSKLIAPIQEGADLTAQWAKPIPPIKLIEKILYAGFKLKYFVYIRYKKGNNVYTCVGHMRALSKRFYSTVKFPTVSEGEDQYLYFLCKNGGFKYAYIDSDNLVFKLPDNLHDYIMYGRRIFQTQKKHGDIFNKKLIQSERQIPLKLQLQACFYGLTRQPIHTLLYILLHLIVQQWSLRQPTNPKHVFEVSKSTKLLHPNSSS